MTKETPKYRARSIRRIIVIAILSSPLLLTIRTVPPPACLYIVIPIALLAGVVCLFGFGVGAHCYVTKTRGGCCVKGSSGILGGCFDHFDYKLDAAWHSLGARNRKLVWTMIALRPMNRQHWPSPPKLPQPGELGYYDPPRTMKTIVALYEIWAILTILNILFLAVQAFINALFGP